MVHSNLLTAGLSEVQCLYCCPWPVYCVMQYGQYGIDIGDMVGIKLRQDKDKAFTDKSIP